MSCDITSVSIYPTISLNLPHKDPDKRPGCSRNYERPPSIEKENIKASKHQNIQTSKHQNIKTSKHQNIQKSKHQNIKRNNKKRLKVFFTHVIQEFRSQIFNDGQKAWKNI